MSTLHRQTARGPAHTSTHFIPPDVWERLRTRKHRPPPQGSRLRDSRPARKSSASADSAPFSSKATSISFRTARHSFHHRQHADGCFHRSAIKKMFALKVAISANHITYRWSNRRRRSGCARCLAPLVKRVLLNARNLDRYASSRLTADAMNETIHEADRVQRRSPPISAILRTSRRRICAARLPTVAPIGLHRPDASSATPVTPKNLSPARTCPKQVFFGGLGQINRAECVSRPDFMDPERHPFPT